MPSTRQYHHPATYVSTGYYDTVRAHSQIHPQFHASFTDPAYGDTHGTLNIQDWPHEPQKLKQFTKSIVFGILGDLIFLCGWLGVLAFSIAIAKSNGLTHDNILFSDNLFSQGKVIIPTLFPILFAATLGRFLKLLSMYRVERGERLEVLDQLLGSTTVTNTVVTALSMLSVSYITIILILIWALSPIGGQAAGRAFSWKPNMTETAASFSYFSSNNTRNIPYRDTARIGAISRVTNVFGGAITSSRNNSNSPMDLWGNVKIPSIEALEAKDVKLNAGWYDASNLTTIMYSSLLGVPVRRADASDSSSRFSLETSYWTLKCSKIGVGQIENLRYSGLNVFTDREDNIISQKDSPNLPSRRIVFNMAWWEHLIADCHIQQTYIETEVLCRKRSCVASKARRSLRQHPSANYTFLDDEVGIRGNLPYFMDLLEGIPGRTYQPTALTSYISLILELEDRNSGYAISDQERLVFKEKMENATQTRPLDIAALIAQVLNTYLIAATGDHYVLDAETRNYTAGVVPSRQNSGLPLNFETAEAEVWTEELIFTCSMTWLVLLFIAVVVPLGACVVNLVLASWVIRGPLLAMNFSTITRDNPYTQIPDNGSAFGDSERGKKLKDLRLLYGDVASEKTVGRIAVGVVDKYGNGPSRLEKGSKRLYA
ncbi:hypothetical protein QBC38DRAFT_495163 [Podospora fimiseda]|uniref:Uncharacterized protein n=1 Tax=Podospora fimiseda TaxID=252190 RepID=A0AAN7BYC8_9PEZI|nr:hypothetical protein QBC38DRAFT_495163 [Podospora fimiseda]